MAAAPKELGVSRALRTPSAVKQVEDAARILEQGDDGHPGKNAVILPVRASQNPRFSGDIPLESPPKGQDHAIHADR